MVLAGPGSGKTYVLTHHIEFLVKNGVPPESILVLTFTKKAAVEMQNRFKQILPSAANRVVFGTFHSVFYRFLKIFNSNTPKIISESEKERILDMFEDSPDSYKKYKELIHERNLMDFDDILDECLKLMNDNEKALMYIKAAFDYALIDEFQDINDIQYEVIKKIFKNHGTVFAVGDQDQSIYAFRGAVYNIMDCFREDFAPVSTIELLYNYRSNSEIVKAAEHVISFNQNRLRKGNQLCINDSKGNHCKIKYFRNSVSERNEIMADILLCQNKNYKTAVLLRTNKEVYYYSKYLLNCRGSKNDNEIRSRIICDIYLYSEYMLSRNKDVLPKIINRPERYIPTSIFFSEFRDLEDLAKQNLGSRMGDRLFVFSNQMKAMINMVPIGFLMYLRNVCKHEEFIIEEFHDYDKTEISQIYDKILNELREYRSLTELNKYLSEEIKSSKTDTVNVNSLNIEILTYHQAKGIEFDAVILPDVIEGKVPCKLSAEECNIEEERRLFYVAMTRAKEQLIIYTIENEEDFSVSPSRFLK